MRAGKVLKIILPAVLELFVYVITKEEEKLWEGRWEKMRKFLMLKAFLETRNIKNLKELYKIMRWIVFR